MKTVITVGFYNHNLAEDWLRILREPSSKIEYAKLCAHDYLVIWASAGTKETKELANELLGYYLDNAGVDYFNIYTLKGGSSGGASV